MPPPTVAALRVALGATALLILSVSSAAALDIAGAGSTFVYPVLAKWAEAYKAGRGVTVNYQSIGSGGGIKQIEQKTVDFGASDAPLPPAELDKFGLMQFPVVIGGDVPVVNLPGIEPGKLKLTGPILADIFLGKIVNWNDKAIAAANSDLSLPDQAIAVIHRSDGSGTTYIWVDYLSKASAEWKDKIGVNTAVEWPVGVGGDGNEGVAELVERTAGAVGYVEHAYAVQKKMIYAQVQNKNGSFVLPRKTAFQIAAANADWSNAPAFFLMLTDQPGSGSWPITGSTFILMHKVQDKPENAKAALQFFYWVYTNGQQLADNLDYVPMPATVVRLVEATWTEIKAADGARVWAAGR
jgi:phosphate transport system substrate-binding protein